MVRRGAELVVSLLGGGDGDNQMRVMHLAVILQLLVGITTEVAGLDSSLDVETRAVRDFAEAFRLMQEPMEPKTNSTFRSLLNDRHYPNRSFSFDPKIHKGDEDLEELMKANNMTMSLRRVLGSSASETLVLMQNSTSIHMTRRMSKYYHWELHQNVANLIIFLMIVVGNVSILHRLKSCRRRRSNVNYFIVQLAIADLCVGIFNVTLDWYLRRWPEFTYGHIACKATKYFPPLFIYSSTYLLVALSIDRWEAVVKPLAFTRSRSRGYYLVLGAWLLAAASATPASLLSHVKEVDGMLQCSIDLDARGWKLYMAYLLLSILIVPAVVIAICYTHIVYTIWSKGQLVLQQQQQQQQPHQAARRSPGRPKRRSKRAHRRHLAGELAAPSKRQQDAGDKLNSSSGSSSPQEPAELRLAVVAVDELSYQEEGYTEDEYVSTEDEQAVARAADQTYQLAAAAAGPMLETPPRAKGLHTSGQQHGSGVIPKARVKTIKMTLVIVAAFILCWAPFCIINFLAVYGMMPRNTFTRALMTLSQSLAHLNSAFNPIIYWLFSSKRNSSRARARARAAAAAAANAGAATSSGHHQSGGRSSKKWKKPSAWDSVLCCCCRLCPDGCPLPFHFHSNLVTDSRIFEATGTTQATGSHCMVSRQQSISMVLQNNGNNKHQHHLPSFNFDGGATDQSLATTAS